MQPPEPAQSETSLELTFEPSVENAATSSAPAELELPPSAAPPNVLETSEEAPPATSGPLANLVVAHFRRVEIAMLGRVLISTLGGALPASMIRLERRRSLGRRLTGRTGEPIGITITAGDRVLSFRAPEVGVVEATMGHTVRGVVLSSTSIPVPQWLGELGELLDQLTSADEATRTALERAMLSP
jgi:hypothetical protein